MKETIILEKPLLSICTISSTDDMKTRLKNYLKYLPKGKDIELIFVETKSGVGETKVVKEDLRFKQATYYWNTKNFNFAEARNYAKSLATGTWILMLDMDDYFPQILIKDLLNILKKHINSDILGMTVGVASSGKNYEKDVYDRININSIRIYRNQENLEFWGYVHETLEHLIPEERILNTGLIINHFGYDFEKTDLILKFKRNLGGLLKMFADDNFPTEEIKTYYMFYLLETKKAIKQLEK